MRARPLLLVTAATTLTLLGCDGSGPSGGAMDGRVDAGMDGGLTPTAPDGGPIPAAALIGPEGGRVATGAFVLTIPPGALAEPTEIRIEESTYVPEIVRTADTPDLEAHLVQLHPPGLRVLVPVVLEFELDSLLPDDSGIAGYWESEDGTVEILEPERPQERRYRIENDHFSFVGWLKGKIFGLVRASWDFARRSPDAAQQIAHTVNREVQHFGSVGAGWFRLAHCYFGGYGWEADTPCCPFDDTVEGLLCFHPQDECVIDTDEAGDPRATCRSNCGSLRWSTTVGGYATSADATGGCCWDEESAPCHVDADSSSRERLEICMRSDYSDPDNPRNERVDHPDIGGCYNCVCSDCATHVECEGRAPGVCFSSVSGEGTCHYHEGNSCPTDNMYFSPGACSSP